MDEKGGGAAVKNSHEKSVYETILIQHNSIYPIDRSFTNYMDKRPFFFLNKQGTLFEMDEKAAMSYIKLNL